VSLSGQFTGTITTLSSDGSGICLTDDATGRQRCSSPMRVVGSPLLVVGEHVDVMVARARTDNGLLNEVYIVTVPPPIATNQ
jgi:hypothetical protein